MKPAQKESESKRQACGGRVLAIDYGRKRMGLALSDELGLTAQPLKTLQRKNRREDLRRMRELVREYGVKRIIVGHPVRLDGTEGEMAEEAEQFAKRLEKELGLPVALSDERLSSWEAVQFSAARRGKKEEIDAVAAAVILRDYLEREQKKK